jgi:hypothetical protein
LKPYDPLRPLAFHYAFPHHFKTKVKKKRFRGRKIIDDYTHVVNRGAIGIRSPLDDF